MIHTRNTNLWVQILLTCQIFVLPVCVRACVGVCMCVFPHLQELCIDLELRNRPALLCGSLSPLLNPSEQVVDGPGNDAQLFLSDVDVEAGSHGVGLPRTRLDMEEKTESSLTLSNGSEGLFLGVLCVVKCVFFCIFHHTHEVS